ncbi:stage III sporulation protein AA [Paenibacillus shirakamiensis]|uniref:Stage III sporulation protein AA n=1 Tax=Paenibacillus shirakamiensis TaxID=1265935 RepID=A0ABS4JCI6_9BACL|nr:stage III sporulation protein AA [Paenibacillus shirakamiensis]MBP1999429.1 stage III sporulation protein AA [Paenibacillus shirakamiensis]
MNWMHIFPQTISSLLRKMPLSLLNQVEEVRVREGRPLEVNTAGTFYFLTQEGDITKDPSLAYQPGREEAHRLLDQITNHSLYTMEEELRKGFITIPGGHRIGLAGRTVLNQGRVEHIRDVSSFNLRVAREIKGVADALVPKLIDFTNKSVLNTLIISPPQQGKTTLIRDLSRQISQGTWGHREASWGGLKVGIIDERSEIAGSKQGVPSFDVGPRTDVMDACPKAEGMMMMIRSMSPEVLIVDEIGRPEDAEAVLEALHAGVRVIATAHGTQAEELLHRPALSRLADPPFFQRYVILQRNERGLSFECIKSSSL